MLSHVQRVTDYILRHEDYFRKVMEEQLYIIPSMWTPVVRVV